MSVDKSYLAFFFYFFRNEQDAIERSYKQLVPWFEGVHGRPHYMTSNLQDGFIRNFDRLDAKLRSSGFSKINYLTFFSVAPGTLGDPANNGHDFEVWWSQGTVAVAADSSIATLSPSSLLPVAGTIIETLEPAYGIGMHTNEPYDAVGADWVDPFLRDHPWRRGILRDVYPWNFLTAVQLEAPVGSQPLAQWIATAPGRGTLAPFARDVVLWEVQQGDVDSVRSALAGTGILFDYERCRQEHIERIRQARLAAAPAPPPVSVAPQVEVPEMDVPQQRRYFRKHPPRCLAGLTAKPSRKRLGISFDGHGEEINLVFELWCGCGHDQFAILGDKPPVAGETRSLVDPLLLRCAGCGQARTVFDSSTHGYNSECQGPALEAAAVHADGLMGFTCPRCAASELRVVARYEYPDDLFDEAEFRGRQQDLFTWFTLAAQCPSCGSMHTVMDQECA